VSAYRRSLAAPPQQAPILISLGADPTDGALPIPGIDVHAVTIPADGGGDAPVEDLFGLVPRRFWGQARDGERRDRLRHVLHELDHDAILFRDLGTLAAARPHVDAPFVVRMPVLPPIAGPVEALRERRFLDQLLRGASGILCEDPDTLQWLRRLDPRLPLLPFDGATSVAGACRGALQRSAASVQHPPAEQEQDPDRPPDQGRERADRA
jgi:hypothetical protein